MFTTSALFQSKDTSAFPSIDHNAAIPAGLHCPLGGNARIRRASASIIRAACLVLTGQVELDRVGSAVVLRYPSSGSGLRMVATRLEAHGKRVWMNSEGRTAPVLLALTDVMLHNTPETDLRAAWEQLVREATASCGRLFTTPDVLAAHSSDTPLRNAMLAFSDAAYFTLKDLTDQGWLEGGVAVPSVAQWDAADPLIGRTPGAKVPPATGPQARLARLVRRGDTALLVGPTGCGKTELVKRVALSAGARLVSTEGRPGLEDRDLIGQIAPTAAGPAWVDGPLAQAFRLAMAGEQVVLKIDELLRFEPYHLNVLIGMLDTVNEDELRAMGRAPVSAGRHYTLKLPGTGEILLAPVSHLSVVATTNAGSAYVQGGMLDPALLRRFSLTMFLSHPAAEEVLPVLVQACGSAQLAKAALALELKLRAQTTAHGGLLCQPSNTGVTLSHLRETMAGILDGEDPQAAFLGAVLVTVAPNVVPLAEDGTLDAAALSVVLDLAVDAALALCGLTVQELQQAS